MARIPGSNIPINGGGGLGAASRGWRNFSKDNWIRKIY